jgi:sulfate adenylyltransferase subunit 2
MQLKNKFDACIGGAVEMRKKELKNVFFLFVMILVNGTKKRPELFDLLNGKIENGQNVRVFLYFKLDRIRCLELYRTRTNRDSINLLFTKRKVFLRDGMIWSLSYVYQEENEEELKNVLFV